LIFIESDITSVAQQNRAYCRRALQQAAGGFVLPRQLAAGRARSQHGVHVPCSGLLGVVGGLVPPGLVHQLAATPWALRSTRDERAAAAVDAAKATRRAPRRGWRRRPRTQAVRAQGAGGNTAASPRLVILGTYRANAPPGSTAQGGQIPVKYSSNTGQTSHLVATAHSGQLLVKYWSNASPGCPTTAAPPGAR
jgi:hypothetical protein